MKTPAFLVRMVSAAAIACLGFLTSCLQDEPEFGREAAYAIEESNIDAYYADADDMAGIAIAESDETAGGRSAAGAREFQSNDDRFCRALSVSLDVVLSTPLRPVGDIILDFGQSCTDAYGNVRSGKVNVHFEGKRFISNSRIRITFENYVMNGIKLNGVRTLTHVAGSTNIEPKFQVELENGSMEWEGKTATREHCFLGTWDRGVLLTTADDQVRIGQCPDSDVAARGINGNGVTYNMYIEEALVYKRGCPMAVSGVKRFVEVNSGKEIIIDYGSGTCDTLFTITVNGNIRNIRK